MENELLELADRLCTLAGMIMEDHNPMAVSTPVNADERAVTLHALCIAASDISKIVDAAAVLVRLS